MNTRHHCRYHPERETRIYCEKYEYGYCEECLLACQACTDPEQYCKFRQHCIIWENCRNLLKRTKAGWE